jgi:hypothetical protein
MWETLCLCWVDVYLELPDQLVHNASKNFSSQEFWLYTKTMAIKIKEVLVKAYNSISRVKRYHAPLQQAYNIILLELNGSSKDFILQMAVKAIKNSASPDGLVPTLLVFGAYPYITNNLPPSPPITQQAEAICKAIKEVRCFYTSRQVKDALVIRNGPNVLPTLSLPIQSDMYVWREKDGWTGL